MLSPCSQNNLHNFTLMSEETAMIPKPEAHRVPLRKRLAYAAPAFGLAVIGIPVYVYVPKFYTDVVGVPIAAAGALLFGVRIFDAITDPALGLLSDNCRSPYGRRRPFIFSAAVLLAATLVVLFRPPAGLAHPTLWLGLSMYSLFLFWTAVTVPYESLGPEISFDYDERTTLFALRDGFLIAGTLAAAAAPVIIEAAAGLGSSEADERRKFELMAFIYAPLLVAACWWCVAELRERAVPDGSARRPLGSALRSVAANRPFMILLAAYTISAFGSNLPATLILYYVEYVLGSQRAELFLLIYLGAGIALLPLWIRLSARVGKRNAWITAMALNTGVFIGVIFLGAGEEWAYGVLVFLSGTGFGATLALPSAIQADVIDYDELATGQRREGLYVGLWSVAKKSAAALGVGVGLYVLGQAGYRPRAEQSEAVLLMLRVLYAGVPSICNLAAILVIWKYPIDAGMHRRIRAAIDRRNAASRSADPLAACATECA